MNNINNQNDQKMSAIVEFYKGNSPDYNGRMITDIYHYTYEQLENVHDYIQWLFPLNKPSYFNKNVPILTKEEIYELKSNEKIVENITISFKLLLNFYGFTFTDNINDQVIVKSANFEDRIKSWMTISNHNFQRISRILKFLKLMGMNSYAELFFIELKLLYDSKYKKIIGKYTYDYWNNAVNGDCHE
jgi:hypothetical protein